MAKELTAGRPVKWYINCAITLAFMLFFRFIPAPEPMTAYGMAVAGIFIGTIYGWCTTNFFFPSLAALFLIGFTQYTTPTGALAKMFSNPQVLQSLFLMLAMAILNATGVTAWVARWIVTRKFLKGRPWLLITMLFVASVVIGLVGNVAGSVMVMWPLVKDIFHEVGYEKGETAPAFVMFGIVVTGMSASMTMPFQIATVSTFAFLFQASDGAITSFDGAAYMGFALPVLILCIAVLMLVFRFVFRIDVSRFKDYEPGKNAVPAMDRSQKIGFVMFIVLFLLLLGPSFIPASTSVGALFNTMGTAGACMLVVAVSCALMFRDGQFFVTFKQLLDRVAWGAIFLFSTAMALSGAINSPEAGLTAFLSEKFAPIFSGMSTTLFLLVFLFIVLLATNVLTNAIVAAVMIPIGYNLCAVLGIDPLVLTSLVCVAVTNAFLFPSGSPAGALLHDNDGWIAKKNIYVWSLVYLAILLVAVTFVGYPLCNALM